MELYILNTDPDDHSAFRDGCNATAPVLLDACFPEVGSRLRVDVMMLMRVSTECMSPIFVELDTLEISLASINSVTSSLRWRRRLGGV